MGALGGPVQNRRRKTGANGLPTGGLYSGEIFFNFVDGTINFGIGSNGGTPDMATSVVTYTLAAFLDALSAQTISGVKTFSASPLVPTASVGDATTKAASTAFVLAQIAAAIGNRDGKESVRALANANVSLSAPGAVIDGVNLAAGDRVALVGQTNGPDNGLYTWNGASAALTRTTDAAASAQVTAGLFFFVTEGAAFADTAWELKTDDPITLGTTALTFGEWDAKAATSTTYSGVDGGYA